mmetsp:Transcript_57358/g.64066  ORF Transcript_57358/g.64066 Transcript_57358/m.64066 type:complete len:102 (+) Transcript_57358:363-668(+)
MGCHGVPLTGSHKETAGVQEAPWTVLLSEPGRESFSGLEGQAFWSQWPEQHGRIRTKSKLIWRTRTSKKARTQKMTKKMNQTTRTSKPLHKPLHKSLNRLL